MEQASPRLLARLRTMRRRPRRPVWSAKRVAWLAILVALGVAVPVLVVGERSLLERAEWVTTIVAAMLWMLLAIGLYRGARIRKDEPLPTFEGVGYDPSSHDLSTVDVPDGSSAIDGGDDPVSAIVGVILWIVFGIALIFLLPLLLNGLLFVLVLFAAALTWVFRRALRQVFVRSPRCRGRLAPTLTYASGYTLLYAGWLLGVLMIAERMQR